MHAAAQLAAADVRSPAYDVAADDKIDGRQAGDVVLTFRYSDILRSDLSVRFVGDQVYLPLGQIFTLLQVDWTLDRDRSQIRGFFVREDHRYILDLRNLVAEIAGRKISFSPGDVFVDGGDVFLRPDLLRILFGLRARIDVSDLRVLVESEQEMPVEVTQRRKRERPPVTDPYAALTHAPLEYDRTRKLVGGGVADYGVALSTVGHRTQVDVQTAAGIELLGGDLGWSARMGYDRKAYLRREWLRWRYVDADNPVLKQVRIGTLTSNGLRPAAVEGIHLTNEPATSKVLFHSYQVAGEAEPGWDVDLYLNDRLVGVTEVGASGHYRFEVPLVYGTSLLHVRMYGPNGEVRADRRRIQIPFSMLLPGEVSYNAYAGRDQRYGGGVLQADLGYGLSKNVTITVGGERTPGFPSPLVYGSVAARFLTRYLANAVVTPNGLRRLAVNGYLPSRASMEVRYDHVDGPRSLPGHGDRHRLSSSVFVPFDVGGRSFSFRMDGSRSASDDKYRYGLRNYLSGRFGRLQVYLSSQSDWSDDFNRTVIGPALSYSVGAGARPISFLKGTIVMARGRYDVMQQRMHALQVSASRAVTRRSRLRLTAEAGFGSTPSSIGFRLSVDLPYAHGSTDLQMRGGASGMMQHVRGSVWWDHQHDQLVLGNRPSVGRAAAAVRLFVDRNGNGSFDAQEHVVEDHAVRIERSSVSSSRGGRITHLSDLVPYERYTVLVDEASIANPLLVPSQPSFSFIADPNSVKSIDVPLYRAGVVEGTVRELRGDKAHPVDGLIVRLKNVETGEVDDLRTFSDGSFYSMGLAPGRYEVRPDTAQLTGRRLEVVSATTRFDIQAGEHGAFVDDIAVVVRPAPLRFTADESTGTPPARPQMRVSVPAPLPEHAVAAAKLQPLTVWESEDLTRPAPIVASSKPAGMPEHHEAAHLRMARPAKPAPLSVNLSAQAPTELRVPDLAAGTDVFQSHGRHLGEIMILFVIASAILAVLRQACVGRRGAC